MEVTSPLRFPSAYEAKRCRCAGVFFQPMLPSRSSLTKSVLYSALYLVKRYTLMRQSSAPLPNFTHFLREDVLGTFILDMIFPCRQQGSHRSVAVSPEEYMSDLSVGTSSQFASSMQMPCLTVLSFTEPIWMYFILFYVKVDIGSGVRSPS